MLKPMAPKIIKSTRFEDGTFTIAAPVAPPPYASFEPQAPPDPAISRAEQEARQILAHARADAEAMIENAREQVARVKEEAIEQLEAMKAEALDTGHQAGIASGHAQGQQEGREELLERHAALLAAIARAASDDAEARALAFAAHERDVVSLALLIAQKILVSELATSRESVTRMAGAALRCVTDQTRVRVRVHPQDLPLLQEAKPALLQGADHLDDLELVGDERVGLGGCLVETRNGRVDGRLATQLAEIASTLLELPPGDEAGFGEPLAAAIAELAAAVPARAEGPSRHATPAPTAIVAPRPPASFEPPAASPAAVPPSLLEAPAQARVPAAPNVTEAAPNPAPAAVYAPSEFPEARRHVPARAPEAEAREPEEATFAAIEAVELAIAPPEPPLEAAPAAELPPAAASASAPRAIDPTRRAAEGLAARLGQLKRGHAVATLHEEYDMSLLEGALSDEALGAIVRSVLPRPASSPGLEAETQLVPRPPAYVDPAEALAARLGQVKKPRQAWYANAGVKETEDGPSEREVAELHSALADDTIDQIMRSAIPVVPPAPGDDLPVRRPYASADEAIDALADRLGQKKKPRQAWYTNAGVKDSEDGPSEREVAELHSALADDTIDQIMRSASPVVPPAPGDAPAEAAPAEAPSLERATDHLAKLLGKKKKGRGAWYEGLD